MPSYHISASKAKSKGREPKCCLGQVLNFKLGCFGTEQVHGTHTTSSRVENSAQVSSCQLAVYDLR
jgi:hypothetical protein